MTTAGSLWKWALRWGVASAVLIPAGLLTGVAALNYSGFCFEEKRYLSDEERFHRTAKGILAIYPDISYAYDTLPIAGYEVVRDKTRCCDQGDMSKHDKSKGALVLTREQLILYPDMDELFISNPDCCSFTRTGLYGEASFSPWWPRLTGYSAGFVNFKFRVRYREAEGDVRTKFSAVSWSQTACGEPSSPLFD